MYLLFHRKKTRGRGSGKLGSGVRGRLQRTLEPVQPVVVVDAQAADAQAAVASAPAVGGFASPAAKGV